MSFLVIGVKKEQSYGLITHKKQQPFVAQKKNWYFAIAFWFARIQATNIGFGKTIQVSNLSQMS